MTNSYQPGFDSNYGTGATSLPLQGASRQPPMSGKPNDYLVLSVLSCIFGFFPLALAAILLSSRVDVLWAVGDYNGALDTAQRAKKFGIWAIIIQVIVAVIAFIAFLSWFAFLMSMIHSTLQGISNIPGATSIPSGSPMPLGY